MLIAVLMSMLMKMKHIEKYKHWFFLFFVIMLFITLHQGVQQKTGGKEFSKNPKIFLIFQTK